MHVAGAQEDRGTLRGQLTGRVTVHARSRNAEPQRRTVYNRGACRVFENGIVPRYGAIFCSLA